MGIIRSVRKIRRTVFAVAFIGAVIVGIRHMSPVSQDKMANAIVKCVVESSALEQNGINLDKQDVRKAVDGVMDSINSDEMDYIISSCRSLKDSGKYDDFVKMMSESPDRAVDIADSILGNDGGKRLVKIITKYVQS